MRKLEKSKSDYLGEEIMKEDVLFKDPKKRAWATCTINGHKEHFLIEGKEYKLRISKAYYDKYRSGIHQSEMTSIIETLKSQAIHYGEIKDTYLRVAQKNGKIYYDLSNENGEMVEIDEDGYRIISANDEIIFERYPHQVAQKYPVESKKMSIGNYVNIEKCNSLLFMVYLITLFIPGIQHPILILYGESGKGKSTLSKVIKTIVDPSCLDLIMPPKSMENLLLTMENNWVVPFDNLSKISTEFSDSLCCMVTGIAQPKRKLYTDNDMYITKIKGCIILNGIENNATRGDLLSRSIILEMGQNKTIRPNNELFSEFDEDVPKILGRIFQVISDAMSIYNSINLDDNFRMAEFAKWGYAIAEAMGGRGEEFLTVYKNNIKKQEDETINSNTLILSILQLMVKRNEWNGRPSDLLRELKRIGYENGLNMHSETMPESAPLLTKKLNAYKSILERVGLEYSHIGHKNNGSRIIIKKS